MFQRTFDHFFQNGSMPTVPRESVMSTLRRIRRRYILPNPEGVVGLQNRIRDSIFADFFLASVNEDAFLFGSEAMLQKLRDSQTWFMDGTFKTRPMRESFAQVNYSLIF